MATVKEIKTELDKRGIKYNPKALKADLKWLLDQKIEFTMTNGSTIKAKSNTKDLFRSASDDFIDPNANPATQA